jgi:chromosome segregation ATPase
MRGQHTITNRGKERMDTTQIAQMVTWLDEEHRRDRGEVAKLQQRIESQSVEILEQARRIQELEGRLASTQAQLVRFTQLDEQMQQLKNEVVLILHKRDEQLEADTRERERARAADREAMARGLGEVRKELNRFGRIEEELALRRSEDQRLSELVINLRQQVTTLSKDIDDRTRTLPYMVEQRTQDNKRIAQLQQETVELFKRIEEHANKLPPVQERLQKVERVITSIQPIPQDLKREQQQFIEQMKLADVERAREITTWHDEIEAQRAVIDRQKESLQAFVQQIDVSKRAVSAIEGFQTAIQRDMHQLTELQRLSEERQQKEIETWEAENEKRWKRQILQWEHDTQEQQKVNKVLATRFPPLEERQRVHESQIQKLWNLHELEGLQRIADAQRWLTQLEELLKERIVAK